MGIEPLLCIGVFVIGIMLQVSLALRDRLLRRWREGIWMRERCARLAGRHGLLGAGEGAWSGEVGGHQVRLWSTVWTSRMQRWLQKQVAHWQGRTRAWHQLGQPQLLVMVRLDEPLPHTFQLQAAIGRSGHIPLKDPIADQLVRANGEDADALRALVRDPAVRGPLYEVLGRYPQSIVTEHAVYLRVEEPVKELEPLLELALELSQALEQTRSVEGEESLAGHRRRLRLASLS